MATYLALRNLHIACVAVSGSLFFVRGLLMLLDVPLPQWRWLKVLPHLNDTLLLAAALALATMSGQYPFAAAWVTAKVFGLIGYIILGVLALRAAPSRRLRLASWLAALAVFGYIVSVALSRNPWGFLARLAN